MAFFERLKSALRGPSDGDVAMAECLEKILRASRRGALVGEANAELIRRLDEKLDLLGARMGEDGELPDGGIAMAESDVLALLDCANGARENVAPGSPAATAIDTIVRKLEEAAGFTRIAAVGARYDPLLTEIVGCAEDAGGDAAGGRGEGAVLAVIQQGYRCADGRVARLAKVAVAAAGEALGEEER